MVYYYQKSKVNRLIPEDRIMNKYKLFALFLTASLAVTAAVGCTSRKDPDASKNPSSTVEPGKLEGIAEKEISVSVKEEADENQTIFKLNNVVDSGMADDNGRYLYLDVSITNSTGKEYDLNTLNNFYLLLPDGNEVHFDVRTQLYAGKNIESYVASPFTIPANGEFSGLIGGFIVDKDVTDMTVCFFPTQDDDRNKSSVVKVNVSAADIKQLNS